ncbi:putative phosphatidate cytidylyltransferase [Magnetofaba australis IT-1]|uniref:Phosphatidate cytidylyltransferase n=1 Tax=Magnetofaba australis IT-1 TaxID=1434232 RepID=A0A1Y2K661_9PROT|nr:putative phosphatidate cytidylyltransferase [Magnetofaba australis IT-1]
MLWLIIGAPPIATLCLTILASVGLMWEWEKLQGAVNQQRFVWWAGGAALFQMLAYVGQSRLIPWVLLIVLFNRIAIEALRYDGKSQDRQGASRIALSLFGLIYAALPLALLMEIRLLDQGPAWICLALFVIWATDSGAYFTGRAMGNVKLAPRLSPKKTREGAIGGLVVGLSAGTLTAYAFELPLSYGHAFAAAAIISLAGQMGDLVESFFKREAAVKDSGGLIPGHGGLLDRLDSLLFATPLYYAYLLWMGLL